MPSRGINAFGIAGISFELTGIKRENGLGSLQNREWSRVGLRVFCGIGIVGRSEEKSRSELWRF